MKNFNKIIIGGLLLVATLSSCKKDEEDPIIPNEEEVITTLKYTLTPSTGGTPVVLTFQDLDGDGGNAPTITGGTINANTSYTGAIELLNETESPAEDITAEVAEEDDEHQLFFEPSASDISVAYTDMDDDGNPIGLATTLTTMAASTGTIKITLRHEPAKSAAGVSAGDITNAGGETDIEVTFSLDVQ
ncbi:MAG: type 1 periplasmic binding fold superfamily protein [Flavobacteriales bacterium]